MHATSCFSPQISKVFKDFFEKPLLKLYWLQVLNISLLGYMCWAKFNLK